MIDYATVERRRHTLRELYDAGYDHMFEEVW
jgi:hypothetical protein